MHIKQITSISKLKIYVTLKNVLRGLSKCFSFILKAIFPPIKENYFNATFFNQLQLPNKQKHLICDIIICLMDTTSPSLTKLLYLCLLFSYVCVCGCVYMWEWGLWQFLWPLHSVSVRNIMATNFHNIIYFFPLS